MACNGNVYIIQNRLWNEQAEQGEAAYGEDFDTKFGVFDRFGISKGNCSNGRGIRRKRTESMNTGQAGTRLCAGITGSTRGH